MALLRALIVDDSVLFRSQIRQALEASGQIEVVGVSSNGRLALERLRQTPVDLVTLDLEMPEMNGLETLVEMRAHKIPAKVIVFASRTEKGADAAMRALQLGAIDFVAKPDTRSLQAGEDPLKILVQKVRLLQPAVPAASHPAIIDQPKRDLSHFLPRAVLIGCSTGGPGALEYLFDKLPRPNFPILIVQHMPPMFTASLAKRLGQLCSLPAGEAQPGEKIEPGRIYMAPGGYHLSLERQGLFVHARIDQGPLRNEVRPAVDPLFETAATIYGAHALGLILTGMGSDGRDGARALKSAGGGIVIQDRSSCVVYGMPGAVESIGAFDEIRSLDSLRELLRSIARQSMSSEVGRVAG